MSGDEANVAAELTKLLRWMWRLLCRVSCESFCDKVCELYVCETQILRFNGTCAVDI